MKKRCHMPSIDQVLLAEPRGFCAGVVRAVDIVEEALELYGAPIYVRREIVHNPFVVEALRQKGAVFVEEMDGVPSGSRAVFSAHGVSPLVRTEAADRDVRVIDATCPLVTKVHLEAVRYARDGYSIILVGHAGHDEIVGTMGEAPEAMQLVETVADAEAVAVGDPQRLAVITQTTLSLDDTQAILDVLNRRFPDSHRPAKSDICYATQNRQNAVKKIAASVDLLLVIGARNSSNSLRLQEVAEEYGCTSYLIDSVDSIKPEWLEGVSRVGVTSGASTPEHLVEAVCALLKAGGAADFQIVRDADEDVFFPLPRELARARSSDS